MNKLKRELNSIDYSQRHNCKRVLNRIHGEILYFGKHNKYMVRQIGLILLDFLSTNETEDDQNRKYFAKELFNLIKLCKKMG